MKALILAGGRGKRLGQLTQKNNKCMLEVKGRPLIVYSLDCASKIGEVSEMVIVVGYQAGKIIKRLGNEYNGKPIKYVFQEEQRGLVHAIECAEGAIGRDDFVLFLGDELMTNPKHMEMIKRFKEEGLFAVCGMINIDDSRLIGKTYGIKEENGIISDLIEKPDLETISKGVIISNLMGTGNCVFRNEIFSYIPKTPINPKRGERELPDLIKTAINDGKTVKSSSICDCYFNVNIQEEIRNAESYFAHFSEMEKHTS